jgi:hypothetical protein
MRRVAALAALCLALTVAGCYHPDRVLIDWRLRIEVIDLSPGTAAR